MARDQLNMQITIDKRAMNFFQRQMPRKLEQAREKAVEAAGIVWADEAKDITRHDNHIDTGLYVNSIGYSSGSPASQSDVIHQLQSDRNETVLAIGSNVAYSSHLEKRYNIMARALDSSEKRMQTVAKDQIKRTLFG